MATAERISQDQVRGEICPKDFTSPVAMTMPQAMSRITTVRMAVARLDPTPATPSLTKMVVRAAKKAESRANPHQGRDDRLVMGVFLFEVGRLEDWAIGRLGD